MRALRRLQKFLLPALFVMIGILYAIQSQAYDAFAADLYDEPKVTVSGRVTERQVKEDYCSYKIKGATFEIDGHTYRHKTLLLYTDIEDDSIPLGCTVTASGTMAAFSKATNEGAFDSYSYYKSLAVSAKLSVNTIETSKPAAFPWREGLRSFRDAVRAVYEEDLSSEDAGVLAAMVLGDKTLLEQDVKQAYQDMGISHILAISGLHISILGMSLYRLLRKKLMLSYPVSCTFSGIVLFLFCLMSGFSVSTQRAFFSFLFYLGAEYTGRTYTTLRALLISAVCILLRNPLAITQTGFLLSYSALLSIQCFLPVLRGLLPEGCADEDYAEAPGEARRRFAPSPFGGGAGSDAVTPEAGRRFVLGPSVDGSAFDNASAKAQRRFALKPTGGSAGSDAVPTEAEQCVMSSLSDGAGSDNASAETRKRFALRPTGGSAASDAVPTEAGRRFKLRQSGGGSASNSVQSPAGKLLSFPLSFLRSILEGIPVSIAIWAGMLPLTAYFFYQIPLFSVLLNMLILPLCGYLLGFSLAGGIIGLFLPAFGRILLTASHAILSLYDLQMGLLRGRFAGAANGAWICGQPPLSVVCLFYAIAFSFCLFLQYQDVVRCFLEDFRRRRAARFLRIRSGSRVRLVSFLIAASVAAADTGILLRPSANAFAVKMLDVGQGDGICITSSDGSCILIDGGSSSQDAVGTYQILPFLKCNAIRSVDIWLVSHTDEDHISGLLEVLEYGYEVDVLAFSNLPEGDENYAALCEAAEANGTRVAYVCEGSSIRTADFTMTCLYPSAEDTSDDANDLSQVWLLENEDLSMLFTGDLGSEQEALLLERGLLTDVDILKVGHHGSKNSSSEEFLEALSPTAALISVGENNLYGHPASETLERLAAQNTAVFATMDYGQLTVRVAGGQIRISGYLAE